ncbi:MAG: hydrolase 2, exosortase A system-associated [Kiloniellales bacterium]|nr:hydrolase 2, exosortase A system-associated [Kiloniellales bacterium]
MTAHSPSSPTAFSAAFAEGQDGRVFLLHHRPPPGVRDRGDIIYLPPFAEEMNRARRMAALQARALAQQGFGTLLLDYYGTGDSAGEFRDGCIETWHADAETAVSWLEAQGRKAIAFWGLRSGALLALKAIGRERHKTMSLVLWQPVLDGKTMLNQFLRVRTAASMGRGGKPETPGVLREMMSAGQTIEVAGYELTPRLVEEIDGMRLPIEPPSCARIIWLEVDSDPERGPSPPAQRILDSWNANGLEVHHRIVVGDPFWQLRDVTLAPALIDATTMLCEEHLR